MKKVHMMPTTCPACNHGLEVLRLGCDACGTTLDGHFAFGRFGRLSRAQLEFLEVFLECRGKIKDVEQRLGVSYPTVVARLDETVEALQREPAAEAVQSPAAEMPTRRAVTKRTTDVLAALERGEITASEATLRLSSLKGEP